MQLAKAAYYIHWPYCEVKCPYCDFNSHRIKDSVNSENYYIQALLREIEYYANLYGCRELTSIYFGGGTPSLLSQESLRHILKQIKSYYKVAEDAEITIEVNPSSYIKEKFLAYKEIGINRISIGVQSFSQEGLDMLGRIHSVNQAEEAISCAGEIFNNYSFDLIYARDGQSLAEWKAELQYALSFNSPHMSLYELTIEPETKFATLVKNGKLKTVSDDVATEFYNITQQLMNEAQMPAYEVSNHAKAGYKSRHNSSYWAYQEYIGVGPGAHSRIWTLGTSLVTAIMAEKQPDMWQRRILSEGHAIVQQNHMSQLEQAAELLLTSMRTREGLDINRFRLLSGRNLNPDVLNELMEYNLVELGKNLQPTEKGLLFVDYIIKRLSEDTLL